VIQLEGAPPAPADLAARGSSQSFLSKHVTSEML
jgi:hypothetical protein